MAQTITRRSGLKIGVRKKRGLRLLRKTVLPHIGLTLTGLLFLAPFAWLFITSIKTEQEIFAIPTVWWPDRVQWMNYVEAVRTIPFLRYTFNTAMIGVLSAVGQVLASPLAAYGFSRISFRGRNVLFYVMMATIILPFQVTMVPVYVMFNKMNMVDSYWPLILPNFFGAAYYIFLLRQFFMNIPYELTESAKIDGASEFRIYWQIVLPLSRPAIYTVALLTFLHAWGDFLGPLIYLNDPAKWTLSIGLRSFIGEYDVSWGLLMAASTLFTVPIIALYFFVQKQFIQGITLTGFK